MYEKRESVMTENDQAKYGSLALGIRNMTLWQVYYSVVFLVRRLVYTGILIFIEDTPCILVLLVFILNTAFIVYIGTVSPHNDTDSFKREMANEWLLQLLTCHLMVS